MSDNPEEILTLTWRKWAATQTVNERLVLDPGAFEAVHDRMFGGLVMRLEKMTLTEHLADEEYTTEIKIPESWWQHLKQDHFPDWWTRRWPVRYMIKTAVVTVSRNWSYPEATIAPELGNPVRLETWSGPDWL